MKQQIKQDKGVTLVALVVTIIVLMILAGITLTLVLGQNGIIGKAKEAKSLSQNAQNSEQEGLNGLYNEILSATKKPEPTVATTVGKTLSDTDNTAIKDDEGNTITIPAGFKIASDSATKQEDGIVVEDKDGNQFVWIPVSSVTNYTRTDFGKQSGVYSSYSETMPSDEQTSISKYHGYYIGRYEAGDKEATNNRVMRNSSVMTDTITIKKGQAPYNYVTRDQAKTLSEGMKIAEGYNATTKLCSSYAWDTSIRFIQNKVPNYGSNSNQGNYYDTTFTYTDIKGESQTKALSSSVLIPTGETTQVCNICDMGGNECEWTTERYSYNVSYPCVTRGAFSGDTHANEPAGFRGYEGTTSSCDIIGFRVALYM